MNLHLAEIATAVAPGCYAVLLVDQAGWHMSDRLVVPINITIFLPPPKCPELSPVENIRQFMRDNWLSNRLFKSYNDIVDHCCDAWNKLVDQPWKIMSIGLRDWAPESPVFVDTATLARTGTSRSTICKEQVLNRTGGVRLDGTAIGMRCEPRSRAVSPG
jgi:transposase